jgi:hypothetical protein
LLPVLGGRALSLNLRAPSAVITHDIFSLVERFRIEFQKYKAAMDYMLLFFWNFPAFRYHARGRVNRCRAQPCTSQCPCPASWTNTPIAQWTFFFMCGKQYQKTSCYSMVMSGHGSWRRGDTGEKLQTDLFCGLRNCRPTGNGDEESRPECQLKSSRQPLLMPMLSLRLTCMAGARCFKHCRHAQERRPC